MTLYLKNNFKKSSLFILVLFSLTSFSSNSIAITVSDAVLASKNSNPIAAVKMWEQLAKTGNVIAQYNLSNYYSKGNGVQKNQDEANRLLKDASRSGLVQAYLNLNKQAISPGNGISLSFNIVPSKWLSRQEPKQYTIQLASSRNKKSIKRTYENNNIKGNGGYYHYIRDGVDRYALIYGSYKTVAEAKVAMKKLPEKLRKKTPWVRKIKSLQNISK